MRNLFRLLFTVCFIATLIPSFAQQVETGEASYYNDKYHGRLTALGDKYDKTLLTAAHRTHHKGTMLKVTNLSNSKTVIVRVNDRGPFKPGRIIDLSRAAAEKIDLIRAGVAQVRVEVVKSPDVSLYNKPKSKPQAKPQTSEFTAKGGSVKTVPNNSSSYNKIIANETVVKKATYAKSVPIPANDANNAIVTGNKKGFAIQVASFEKYVDATNHVAALKKKWFKNIFIVVKKDKDGISRYRIMMGPFDKKSSAMSYRNNLKLKYKINGLLVDLK